MPKTYEPIATTTLGSAQTTITFSSIPQTYTDLVLIYSAKYTSAGSSEMRFNGDTSNNYSLTYLYGNGSAAGSGRNSTQPAIYVDYTGSSTNFVLNKVDIMNYTNATTFKTVLIRTGDVSTQTAAEVALWRKTPEAITTISLFYTSNFAIGSTFTLYGIKAA